MSLFRTASGPAGLSINTTAANTGGTATGAAPAAGGLFGTPTNTASNTNTGGGLFGQPQQTQGTTGGLFGGAAANTNTGTAATGPGLFGGAANTQQQTQQTGGGLFGNSTAGQTQQSTTGGGLFGGATQQQQPATGGLFGGQQKPAGGLFSGAPASNPVGGGGFFGNSTNNNTAASNPAGGGLFGNATNTGGGLFSNTQPQQPQQSGGLFGNMGAAQQQPQQPAAGGLFGQAGSALVGSRPTQTISGAQINWDTIQARTRVDDLAKPVQDDVVTIDTGIERIKLMKQEIQAMLPKHRETIETLSRDVNFVEAKYKNVERILRKDVSVVNGLKEATKTDIDNAQVVFQGAENLKLPAVYHTPNLWAPAPKDKEGEKKTADVADLITLFNKAAIDLEARHKKLTEYRAEIADHLPNVENGLYERVRALREHIDSDKTREDLKGILETVKDLNDTIINMASQCVQTRDRLEAAGVRLPPVGSNRSPAN